MVAERRGLADWYTRIQHAQARPPPSYHRKRGTWGSSTKNL